MLSQMLFFVRKMALPYRSQQAGRGAEETVRATLTHQDCRLYQSVSQATPASVVCMRGVPSGEGCA